MTELTHEVACCYCGDTVLDGVDLAARWTQDSEEQTQHWPAHRSCLMQSMGREARASGGPLFEISDGSGI